MGVHTAIYPYLPLYTRAAVQLLPVGVAVLLLATVELVTRVSNNSAASGSSNSRTVTATYVRTLRTYE